MAKSFILFSIAGSALTQQLDTDYSDFEYLTSESDSALYETDNELIENFGSVRGLVTIKQQTSEINLNNLNDSETNKIINYLHGYGCYCFPDKTGNALTEPRYGYAGPAVDELDDLCRKLYFSQKCLNMGRINNNLEECDLTRAYPFYTTVDPESPDGVLQLQCGRESSPNWINREESQCQYQNCLLEQEFIARMKDLIENQNYTRNNDFVKMDEETYKNNCPALSIRNQDKHFRDQCCGVGLDVMPYSDISRVCCQDQIVEIGSILC